MFTYFRYADTDECVRDLIQPPPPPRGPVPPLYRSRFACKVREDLWKAKGGKIECCPKLPNVRICECVGIEKKPPVPCSSTGFGCIPTCDKDYLTTNIRNVIRQVPMKPALRYVDDRVGTRIDWCTSGLPRKFVCTESFGKIPDYIQCIKEELYVRDQQAKFKMLHKDREFQDQCRHLEDCERRALICGLKKELGSRIC